MFWLRTVKIIKIVVDVILGLLDLTFNIDGDSCKQLWYRGSDQNMPQAIIKHFSSSPVPFLKNAKPVGLWSL